jgi:solute carrier family 31 (copper transporter), member 1
MLWNWYTIDACFLSRSWYITSKSMFAGSCIGVIILVMILEFLRRLAKEYDRRLVRQHQQRFGSQSSSPSSTPHINDSANKDIMSSMTKKLLGVPNPTVFRPHLGQQMLRALLHMLQFAVAYFIMLLAMYYNGYILICIFIGAYLGFFVFEWESADME